MDIPKMPEPGTQAWEDMVDFMRDDLESGMQSTKIEIIARELLTKQGRDFDEEFENWRKEKNNEIHRTDGTGD